eukprot:CAMPEP_0171968842 /NCGR_PEP_ID=MMETSP0993-20121228/205550_1 /TAXON_ID=483369 /ORGANISM="non described non described, Strain CCMP2098" /LENGTH=53 /DNA_ID=CAMNT_0012618647 /DNA_START=59 /DNA_END=217 /DNA_ORIENTATION=-
MVNAGNQEKNEAAATSAAVAAAARKVTAHRLTSATIGKTAAAILRERGKTCTS